MYIQNNPPAFGHQEALYVEISEEESNVYVRDMVGLFAIDIDNKYSY